VEWSVPVPPAGPNAALVEAMAPLIISADGPGSTAITSVLTNDSGVPVLFSIGYAFRRDTGFRGGAETTFHFGR